MVDITYYFTSKIPNAATSIFYPRIHQSEMHDHVSAHSEKRVSICCAYTHQLHWLRWSEYICKLGLLLAESSTYPYKTTLIWNTDFFVHVCSLAFIQQTSSSPDGANDTVEEMSKKSRQTDQKKKRYHRSDKAVTHPFDCMGKQVCSKLRNALLRSYLLVGTGIMQRHRFTLTFWMVEEQ